MPKPNSLIDQLILEAEFEVERMIGLVRVTVALLLLSWFMASFSLDNSSTSSFVAEPTFVVPIALGGFLIVGLASFLLARARLFRPWMAFALTATDAAVVSAGLFAVLRTAASTGNWLPLLPGLWVAPLLLTLGALRYRPAVQIWATLWLVLGLGISVLTLGFDPQGPTSGAGQQIDHLLSIVPTVVRGILLSLTGLIGALVMWRSRALLLRAVTETARRANLARFLPNEIAPLLDSDQIETWRKGRRQQVAILFVDIRDSTALAELMDPTRLSVLLASFRRRILHAAAATGGVVDKFMGDGALVLFGVPEPRADDPARALACARELLRLLDKWNSKRGLDRPIRVGIGIHTGQVYCGLVGDETRLEFTVLGDAVNAAARIEEETKRFGQPLLASEPLVSAAHELDRWQVVTVQPLRGRAEALTILSPAAS